MEAPALARAPAALRRKAAALANPALAKMALAATIVELALEREELGFLGSF